VFEVSLDNRAKWTGSVTQAVKYLLCKCKALTSNSSATHEKIISNIY
jgi:hypothetical protein